LLLFFVLNILMPHFSKVNEYLWFTKKYAKQSTTNKHDSGDKGGIVCVLVE